VFRPCAGPLKAIAPALCCEAAAAWSIAACVVVGGLASLDLIAQGLPTAGSRYLDRLGRRNQPLRVTPWAEVTWSDPERLSTVGVSGLCPCSRLA